MGLLKTRVFHRLPTFVLFSCVAWAVGPVPPNPLDAVLTSLPTYGVFDYLTARAEGGKIVLLGQVTTAELKQQAERTAREHAGSATVEVRIDVLPKSIHDDAVRESVYRSIYKRRAPSVYEETHSIHIVVRDESVTLEGTVNDDIDRILMLSSASGAAGVHGTTDHLSVISGTAAESQWRRELSANAPSRLP